MSLEGFKEIFFWEYLHRIMGRIVGLLCLLPTYGSCSKKARAEFSNQGFDPGALVGAQGLMGWYMVQSGLVSNPEVSHYRLAAHLGPAFSIFGLGWWMLQDLNPGETGPGKTGRLRFLACLILGLLCLQITYGAFTSGMKAGYGFNTFPMMEKEWFPKACSGFPLLEKLRGRQIFRTVHPSRWGLL